MGARSGAQRSKGERRVKARLLYRMVKPRRIHRRLPCRTYRIHGRIANTSSRPTWPAASWPAYASEEWGHCNEGTI